MAKTKDGSSITIGSICILRDGDKVVITEIVDSGSFSSYKVRGVRIGDTRIITWQVTGNYATKGASDLDLMTTWEEERVMIKPEKMYVCWYRSKGTIVIGNCEFADKGVAVISGKENAVAGWELWGVTEKGADKCLKGENLQ